MEIAECHLVIPITVNLPPPPLVTKSALTLQQMMRYRAKFQRSAYPVIVVDPADEGDILEEKWKLWHQRESWKRLVTNRHAPVTTQLTLVLDWSSIVTYATRKRP